MTAALPPVAQRATAHPERVVGDLLRTLARVMPTGRFVTCGESEPGFATLDARTDSIAAGLAEAGVGKGDRVAIVCTNRIEMIELFFAVAKLGAIQVPLNAYLKGEFLRYQLADSQASALVVDASALAAVAAVAANLPDLRLLVLLDDTVADTPASEIQVRAYADLTTATSPPVVELQPADLMSRSQQHRCHI